MNTKLSVWAMRLLVALLVKPRIMLGTLSDSVSEQQNSHAQTEMFAKMAELDSPEFIDSALQVYHREVRRSVKAQEERLQQLQSAQDQLQQTMAVVQDLPMKLRHQVVVPFGRHAFFPGQLTHTNEFLVHLGDQYYVETTAAAAQGILQRKLAVVTDGVQNAEQQRQSLQARLDLTQSTLRDDTSADSAMEIRSTLEESDDLLAAAEISRRMQRQSLAAAAVKGRQQQHPVSRVTAAAGYSYTPLKMPEPSMPGAAQQQQQQHRELDDDDLALQARLEELIRLEEQQEIAELEQGQQQQQQWQQGALASIAEGDEEQDEASAAAAAAVSSRLGAAERLQQLEAEADSDDEEQQHHGQQQLPHEPTQQQHPKEQPLAAASPAVVQHRSASRRQSLQHIQQQPQASSSQSAASGGRAPASPAVTGRKPLKSALKKGFLAPTVPAAWPLNNGRSVDAVHAAATSQNKPKNTSSQAFTGAVVERPSPSVPVMTDVVMPLHAAPVPAVGAVLEKPVAASSGAVDSGSGGPRVSKFKLRRMGLESPSE